MTGGVALSLKRLETPWAFAEEVSSLEQIKPSESEV